MDILLLTENILVEEKLQNKIQMLGHEVFVNKSFLYNIDDIFYFNYDVCIVSNTISNSKVEKVISNVFKRAAGIVFICESFFGRDNTSFLDEILITRDESLENLKEKLEISNERERTKTVQGKLNKNGESNMLSTDLHLSMNEQRVFSILTANENQALSREEICEHVWDKNYTDSRKSQLSSLVKRINEKMRSSSMSSHEIKTLWGKGYAFSRGDAELK